MSDKLDSFTESLRDFLGNGQNRQWIKQQLMRWYCEYRKATIRVRRFDLHQELHFREYKTNRRYRDEKAGPPGDGWVFEGYPNPHGHRQPRRRITGRRTRHKVVFGIWMPQSLSIRNRPSLPDLPFPLPKRELSTPEQCAVLAAIYNHVGKATRAVKPADRPRGNRWPSIPQVPFILLSQEVTDQRINADLPWLVPILKNVITKAATEVGDSSRLVSDGEAGGNGERPTPPSSPTAKSLATREDPPVWIPLVWLRGQVPKKKVGGDAKKLGKWLGRRGVKVCKMANKLHVKQSELLGSGAFRKGSEVYGLIEEYEGE